MISQLSLRSVSILLSNFLLAHIRQSIPSFQRNLKFFCVFNVFLGTRYAMISQLSMRNVSILYSNFSLALVR